MAELPKSVLQALVKAVDPPEHPAADLLTAFVERRLTGTEREKLLAHLGRCEPCRAVVWCAMPDNEVPQDVVVSVSSQRWFAAWRWVGVAAGVVLIAGVAVLFRGGPGPAGERMASAPAAPIIAAQPDKQILANEAQPKEEARLKVPAPAPAAPRMQAKLEAKDVAPKAAPGRRDQAALDDMANRKGPYDQAGSAGKATDMVAGESASRAVGGLAASAPRAMTSNSVTLATVNPVPASTAEAGVMISSNQPVPSLGKKKLAPPTLWMLSADGALLRSTDSGKNWQAVPFEGKVVFRAVAVVGPRVWVGGQGGVLYYSGNDGSDWQRLTPSADGATLDEDIRVLVFQDNQHGNLTTAGGHNWATSDGGRSWHKQ